MYSILLNNMSVNQSNHVLSRGIVLFLWIVPECFVLQPRLTCRHNWGGCSSFWGEERFVSPTFPNPERTYERGINTQCMHTYRHIVAIICLYLCAAGVQHVGAVQEVLVLSPGHHRLRKLSQVQLEKWCHRVDICVTAGNDMQKIIHITVTDIQTKHTM